MRYRILGPLEVHGVVDHPALRRRKPRIVLAVLLLHANEVVSTDALIDAVWGASPPERAKGSLQNYVSHLRKALGGQRLVSEPGGYLLRVEPGELDAEVFERLVREASGTRPAVRAERLRAALGLWRGPALDDFAYSDFAAAAIKRLDDARGTAYEELTDAELALGRHAEAAVELEALVVEYPWRERLRRQLMLALYRSGRQAEALRVYRDAWTVLSEELGLEPSVELRQLEQAILNHDAALGSPALAPAEREPMPTVRKVVTVLFADVAGSTRLASTVDAETLRSVMGRFFAAMRAVAERHGGTLEKFSGDDVMVVFGVPTVYEDHAVRAVRAGAEMRDALAELNRELERDHGVRLEVRIGVNTGEVIAGDPDEPPFVTGEAVNVGKRLQEAAAPGDVLLAPATVSLARGSVESEQVGTLELRGRPEPLPTHRLVGLVEEQFQPPAELGPLVGRRRELRRLRAAYTRVRGKRLVKLAVVVAEPGLGKTRLVRELVNGIDDAQILIGRCVSYGEGATYLPLVEVLRQATRERSLDELLEGVDEAERVASVLRVLSGELDEPIAAGEASRAFQRFVSALARETPVVLILDDVHWAAPELLSLVEHVVAQTHGVAVLVIAIARPELIRNQPEWAKHADGPEGVRLEPLADEDTRALVASRGGTHLEPPVVARLVETAEGNPLFAEQLLLLVGERGPDALGSLPPTVEALIASRLDGLGRRERAALERAAVIGRDFRELELIALSPPDEAAIVARTLSSLAHDGFVRRRRVAATDDTFAFQHVLIRDAAYAGIPKARRAELHEQLGDWLTEEGAATDEIVGFHLETAYRTLQQLGPVGRRGRQLAGEASELLGRAGMRAFRRTDLSATSTLLERAIALHADDDRTRELLVELGIARGLAGSTADAEALVREALERAQRAGDRRMELRATMELEGLELNRHGRPSDLLEIATNAVPDFETFRDHRALGRAWVHIGWVRGAYFCDNAGWEEAAERALVHYRASGWPTTRCAGDLGAALYFGPRHVDEALPRVSALLDDSIGPGGEANVFATLARLEAQRGNVDLARQLIARASAVYDSLGSTLSSLMAMTQAGEIELIGGDFESAARLYRKGCTELDDLGFHSHLSTEASMLADALCSLGADEEAEEWAERARSHAGEGDVSAGFSWRSALARIRARQGLFEEAESLAREARRLVETTDALNQQGKVLLALGEVLQQAGRTDEAAAAVDAALDAFERKGNVVSAARAREIREVLAPA